MWLICYDSIRFNDHCRVSHYSLVLENLIEGNCTKTGFHLLWTTRVFLIVDNLEFRLDAEAEAEAEADVR